MKYRTRNRNTFYPNTLLVYRIVRNGVDETNGYYTMAAVPRIVKVMNDTVGNPGGDYNPCRNIKARLPKPFVQWLVTTPDEFGGYSGYQLSSDGFRPLSVVPSILNSYIDGLDSFITGFTARADNEFRTAIQEKVSLPNFLIELFAPVKTLMNALRGNFRRMISLRATTGNQYWKLKKRYREGGMSEVASNYLAYQYAIKPFISDMKKLLESFKGMSKRLDLLLKYNHKDFITKYRQKKSFEFSIEIPMVEPFPYQEQDPAKDLPFKFIYEGEVSVRATSWATVRFNIPDELLRGRPGLALAWLVWTGFLNPLGVAWEATKFSWLIDWFRSDESKIRQKRITMSPLPDASISGIGSTLFRVFAGDLYIVEIANPDNRVWAGFASIQDYDRRPGTLTDREDLLTSDPGLSSWQASILVALGAQRARRGHRHL